MTAYGQGRGRHVEQHWRGRPRRHPPKTSRTIEQQHHDLMRETRFIERAIVVFSLCVWGYVGWLVIEKVIG